MPRYAWKIVWLTIFCIGPAEAWTQVDSLGQRADSLAGSDAGRPDRSFEVSPAAADSTIVPAWFGADSTPDNLWQRLDQGWQGYHATYGPRIYTTEEEKTRLYLRFPKRDSLDIPFLKGLLPAPATPPYDPTIAWQRSALIPGWGQAYNRSAWKIPIFLLGYGGAAWWINYNHQQYQRFSSAYYCLAVLREDGIPCSVPNDVEALGDPEGIRNLRQQARQNRDNAVLILLGWHGLQVIEAFVDAHLKNFDVSPDLSWKLSPRPIQMPASTAAGLGFSLHF